MCIDTPLVLQLNTPSPGCVSVHGNHTRHGPYSKDRWQTNEAFIEHAGELIGHALCAIPSKLVVQVTKTWQMDFFYHHGGSSYDMLLHDEAILHRQHAGCPTVLLTLLRDPVERLISEFFHYGQDMFQSDMLLSDRSGIAASMGSLMLHVEQDPQNRAFPRFGCPDVQENHTKFATQDRL